MKNKSDRWLKELSFLSNECKQSTVILDDKESSHIQDICHLPVWYFR